MKKLTIEINQGLVGLGIAVGLMAGLQSRVATKALEVKAPQLQALPQAVLNASLVAIETEKIFELRESGKPPWGPMDPRLSSQGHPMAIDFGEIGVKLSSPAGHHQSTFGFSPGQGSPAWCRCSSPGRRALDRRAPGRRAPSRRAGMLEAAETR